MSNLLLIGTGAAVVGIAKDWPLLAAAGFSLQMYALDQAIDRMRPHVSRAEFQYAARFVSSQERGGAANLLYVDKIVKVWRVASAIGSLYYGYSGIK